VPDDGVVHCQARTLPAHDLFPLHQVEDPIVEQFRPPPFANGIEKDIEMRHVVALAALISIMTGCVNQKDGPSDPDRVVAPASPFSSDEGSQAVSPTQSPADDGTDISEATLIPGNPEATHDPGIGRIKVYSDFESFDAATAELTVIDFEDLPVPGSSCPDPAGFYDSIPNPLQIGGVTFYSPQGCLESRHCSDPTCPGGEITLTIHLGSTIALPPGAGGILLAVEGIGDDHFSLLATDRSGAALGATSQGVPYSTSYLGFLSAVGIAEVRVIDLGSGDLVLADVYYEAP
jgi:hypothetical protein